MSMRQRVGRQQIEQPSRVAVKLLRQACSRGSAGRPQGSAPLQRSVPIWACRRHHGRGADPCGRPADPSLSSMQTSDAHPAIQTRIQLCWGVRVDDS